MLNELQELSEALGRAGVTPKDWHKDFKPLPKASSRKPCYRVFVGTAGAIKNITFMDDEQTAALRKYEPSLGNSFPGFNIVPLFRIATKEQKEMLNRWRGGKEQIDAGVLRRWCSTKNNSNWDPRIYSKLAKCLREIPRSLSESMDLFPKQFKAVEKLIERVVRYPQDDGKTDKEYEHSFYEALRDYTIKKLAEGESLVELLPFLFYETAPEKDPKKDRGSQLSVFLDIPDWSEYPVAHHKTIEWINTQLTNKNPTKNSTATAIDAFGLPADMGEEKLPSVRLDVIGDVKLRAMNSESPCQARYGTIDASSYPVGGESRRKMKSAIEWLGKSSYKDLTWSRVDNSEVLFAYPSILPPSPIKLASCFGAERSDESDARFADVAKEVIQSLKGLGETLRNLEIRVFSLRKMDKARTKVVFHRNYTAQRLVDSAKEWQSGCENLPPIRFRIWGKEKGEIADVKPRTPFPLQLSHCINQAWRVDGIPCGGKIECVPKTVGVELLLDEQLARIVPHLLSAAIANLKNIVIYIGGAAHKREVIHRDQVEAARIVPSVLGLLLSKSNIPKEVYMTDAAFLVGRMLRVADDLHAVYCKEVRGGHMPPQLIGNALMVAALETPASALGQLALRLAPYLGWAKTNGSESAGLSRYFLKQFNQISVEIANQLIPARLNDAGRAQVLLGYLADNATIEGRPSEIQLSKEEKNE